MNRIALWRFAASAPDSSPHRQAFTRNPILSLLLLALAALCAPQARAYPSCTWGGPYPYYILCQQIYPYNPGRTIGLSAIAASPEFLGLLIKAPPKTQIEQSVAPATGNMFWQVQDYTSAGSNPLQLIRYYNSLANRAGGSPTWATEMGENWRTNFDRFLYLSPAVSPTTIVAERPDGSQYIFNWYGGAWVTDSDVDYTLTQVGSNFILTGPDDTVETYPITAYGGLLVSTIAYRNGYTQSVSWSLGQGVTGVTDSYGRSLSMTYNGNNQISSVTTPDSLVLSYGYTWVSSNSTYNLTSVSYNTSPATSQTYAYTDTLYYQGTPYAYGSAVYSSGSYGNLCPNTLKSITDENGNEYATWAYSATCETIASAQGGDLWGGTPGPNLKTYAYNSSGTVDVINPNGVDDTYTFTSINGLGAVSSISRAATGTTAAASESFTYDGNGFLASVTDWNSNVTNYTNNSHGLPTSITEAYGSPVARTTSIAYDATWVHLPDSITTTGLTRSFTYDGSGNVATVTDTDTTSGSTPYSTNGQTRTTTLTWDGTGELLTAQMPRTDATVKYTLTWSSGALATLTDQLSHQWQITATTGGGYPTTIVDPNSVTTTLGWDTRLNLNTSTLTTGGGNLVTTWTHDPANELTSLALPDGSTLSYAYDNAHRLTTVTDLAGNTINATLDALGNVTALAVKNSGGSTKYSASATIDALGRKLTDVDAASNTTTYTYDANGNRLSIAPPSPSGTMTLTYDALNRLATKVDPTGGGTTTLTYNAHNQLTNVQDANGNSTSYVLDGFGDVIGLTSPDTGSTVFYYDKDRNLTQKVLNGGQTANYTWDVDERNLTITYPADSSLNVSKTWDQSGHGKGVGRLTSVTDQAGSDSFTYEERGLVTAESRVITGIGTLATSTSYDGAGRVSSITYPSGTLANYTRNSMGLVTGVSATPYGGSATTIASSIAYNPFGPISGLTFGNAITGSYSYDSSYRNTGRTDTATAGDIIDLAYAYKNNGSLYTITDGVTSANDQTFGYDAMNRLTSATSGAGGYGSYGLTWDYVGNIASQDINSVTTTYSLNAGTNQLASFNNGTTTTTVDTTSNGNILDLKISGTPITSFTYSAANRLASGTGPLSASASFKYGFNGMRLLKTPSSGYPITLQYGPGGALLAENDLHSGQTADYIYLDPGIDNRPIGEVNPSSGDVYYTHTDRQGTPQAVTDSGQSVDWYAFYNPFGDTATFSGSLTTQNLRLPGQYFDPELGTNHNGFRDYAGPLTRYIESDPIGLGGGMNTYQYANNNPGMFTDPLGLDGTVAGNPKCIYYDGPTQCNSAPQAPPAPKQLDLGGGGIGSLSSDCALFLCWSFDAPDDDDSADASGGGTSNCNPTTGQPCGYTPPGADPNLCAQYQCQCATPECASGLTDPTSSDVTSLNAAQAACELAGTVGCKFFLKAPNRYVKVIGFGTCEVGTMFGCIPFFSGWSPPTEPKPQVNTQP